MIHEVVSSQSVRLLNKDNTPPDIDATFPRTPPELAQSKAAVLMGIAELLGDGG